MSFPEARVLPESQELSFHDIHHYFMKMFPRQLISCHLLLLYWIASRLFGVLTS